VTGASSADGPLVEMIIGGMTCSSCAVRIERRLNRLDGVSATVSYATERAYVTATTRHRPAELIEAVEAAGYTARLASEHVETASPGQARDLGTRLIVCVPLAIAVIVLAMVPAAQFPGWQWLSLGLAGPVAVWGGWPLHRAAWRSLGQGTATMDTLVSLGVTASVGWSLYALLFGGAGMLGMTMPFAVTFAPVSGSTLYLDVAAGVTTAVLAGRYLEARAKRRSGAALTALASLGAKTVAVLRDGTEQRIPVGGLSTGDLFVVRPGEKIATDGVVAEGSSAVDAAMVTGEAMPAEVGPGDEVTGGCISVSGRLLVRATRVGADTLLAQITELTARALASKAATQRLADRIAAVFVPCVITLAVVTLGFWLGAGLPAAAAWSAAIAVLVVACPCALGLATPAALAAAVGRGAELGILVKSARALESAGRVGLVAFDKTGTLTTGQMTLHAITTVPGAEAGEVLRLAGAVEDASEHPVGQAITRAAADQGDALPPVSSFTSLPGSGVRGTVEDHAVTVGSAQLFSGELAALPADLRQAASEAGERGDTAVFAGWDGQPRAVLAVGDAIRAGSAETVARIRDLGLDVVLVTGDGERTARAIAGRLAIPPGSVFAGVRPDGKAGLVRDLQAAGQPVAVVGDGVNDAAALAAADLGMAVGSGTDAAIGAADLTLVTGDPRSVVDALRLARATLAIIRTNLAWAFGYNLVAIPLAAAGYLNPLFAGVAMSASSLIVVTNSLRLRGFRSTRPAGTVSPPPVAAQGASQAPPISRLGTTR